jgi:hypothetical protein
MIAGPALLLPAGNKDWVGQSYLVINHWLSILQQRDHLFLILVTERNWGRLIAQRSGEGSRPSAV